MMLMYEFPWEAGPLFLVNNGPTSTNFANIYWSIFEGIRYML